MDACKPLVARAQALDEACWVALERQPKYEVRTQERHKPENVKERIIKERRFKTIRLKQ